MAHAQTFASKVLLAFLENFSTRKAADPDQFGGAYIGPEGQLPFRRFRERKSSAGQIGPI
jgi:hypothetical protein